MKCIYRASTGVEAHMIANLLQQSGIETIITGEYLQGGIGELPMESMVEVSVADLDFVKAQEIIKTWNEIPVTERSDYSNTRKSSRIGVGLVLGLLIGFGTAYWAYNSPTTYNGIDYDNDGVLDEIYEYRDNRIYRTQTDRNLDGLVDVIYRYSRKGKIYRSEVDDNFDGVFETTITYKQGNPVLVESDTDQDGEVDLKVFYTHGVPTASEILGPTASSSKMRHYFKMSKLVSSEFDSNGDGVYDKQYTYDYYERAQ